MVWWMWATQANPFLAGFSDGNSAPSKAAVDGAVQSLSKHGLQASCMWTPADGFYQFSDNWMQVTGQFAPDCMGEQWIESWHPQLQKQFMQALSDMFSAAPEDRTDCMVVEGDVMRGEGAWATLELAMMHCGHGGAQKLSLLVCDMTQQRNMQQQVMLSELQSKAVEHCRSSFLSNMSHELRTPLNAIMGFAQMLEMQQAVDEDSAKDYLKHIRLSGEELLTKISDLIELANIDAGQSALHPQPINVSEAVAIATEMQSHRAFSKRITLKQISDNPHLVIMADRSRLLHCITHLLADAIDQSQEGGQVHISYQAKPNQEVTICVEDFGGGMSQRRLQNVRSSLRRTKSYYQTDIEDISIGLSVCKEMIELHGGKLSIDSMIGRGTQFTLHLPASAVVSFSATVRRKSKQFG